MLCRREGAPLVQIPFQPLRPFRQIHMSALNGGRHGVYPGHLAALRIHRHAEHLSLEHIDHRAAVGLILNEHRSRLGIPLPHLADGPQRSREVQVFVPALAQVIVVSPPAPHGNGHKVVVLRPFEGRVHADDLPFKGRHRLFVVKPPPFPADKVALFPSGRALIQRLPGPLAAPAVGKIAALELLQPLFVLPQLRAKGISRPSSQRVIFFRLHRQAQQADVLLRPQHCRRQIVLVPGGHDQNHLSPCRQTAFKGVQPLLPDPPPHHRAVRFHAVFDGVVQNDQLRGVARDASHQSPADEPPGVTGQLKFRAAADAADLHAKQRPPKGKNFFLVPSGKALSGYIVVGPQNDPLLRPLPQYPGGQALRHRFGFPMLGRCFDHQNVVGVAAVRFQKPLHLLGKKFRKGRPLPIRSVNVGQILSVPSPCKLPCSQLPAHHRLVHLTLPHPPGSAPAGLAAPRRSSAGGPRRSTCGSFLPLPPLLPWHPGEGETP